MCSSNSLVGRIEVENEEGKKLSPVALPDKAEILDKLDLLKKENETMKHKLKVMMEDNAKFTAMLVNEIKKTHQKQIEDLKTEYENKLLEVETRNAVYESSIVHQLWLKFRGLNRTLQVLVVIGISTLNLILGQVSWHLIAWLWPILIKFAKTYLMGKSWIESSTLIVNLEGYETFVNAWKIGKPLTTELVKTLGYGQVVGCAIQVAPILFKCGVNTVSSVKK